MLVILWQYQVKPDRAAEFENIYSATGAWAELFRKAGGYLGTELYCDRNRPGQYLTIDRWDSAQEYESFLSTWKAEYDLLDLQCEGLTEAETPLGRWETI